MECSKIACKLCILCIFESGTPKKFGIPALRGSDQISALMPKYNRHHKFSLPPLKMGPLGGQKYLYLKTFPIKIKVVLGCFWASISPPEAPGPNFPFSGRAANSKKISSKKKTQKTGYPYLHIREELEAGTCANRFGAKN